MSGTNWKIWLIRARDYAAVSDFSPERLEQVHQTIVRTGKADKKIRGFEQRHPRVIWIELHKRTGPTASHAESSASLSKQLSRIRKIYPHSPKNYRKSDTRMPSDCKLKFEKEFAALAMERMEMHVQFDPHDEEKRRTISRVFMDSTASTM